MPPLRFVASLLAPLPQRGEAKNPDMTAPGPVAPIARCITFMGVNKRSEFEKGHPVMGAPSAFRRRSCYIDIASYTRMPLMNGHVLAISVASSRSAALMIV